MNFTFRQSGGRSKDMQILAHGSFAAALNFLPVNGEVSRKS